MSFLPTSVGPPLLSRLNYLNCWMDSNGSHIHVFLKRSFNSFHDSLVFISHIHQVKHYIFPILLFLSKYLQNQGHILTEVNILYNMPDSTITVVGVKLNSVSMQTSFLDDHSVSIWCDALWEQGQHFLGMFYIVHLQICFQVRTLWQRSGGLLLLLSSWFIFLIVYFYLECF